MTVELSEDGFEKIKTAKATLDLISQCDSSVEIMDSIRQVCIKSFMELCDVVDEIRNSAEVSL